MRQILLVVTPISENKLYKAIETIETMLKSLRVTEYSFDVMSSSSRYEIPKSVTLEYREVDLLFREAIEDYDDVYIIEDNDLLTNNSFNGYTFGAFARTFDKYNIMSINHDVVEVNSLKDVMIDDFIGDAFVVKKDHAEIQKFINIYLDNVKLGADTPENSKMVKEAKIGLNILLNKLQGINAS